MQGRRRRRQRKGRGDVWLCDTIKAYYGQAKEMAREATMKVDGEMRVHMGRSELSFL